MKYRAMLEVFVHFDAESDEEAEQAACEAIANELMKMGAEGVGNGAHSIIVWKIGDPQ